MSLPVVVIVGRPNVGKSTLFNAITRQRRSIVGDQPGITRDRISGEAGYQGRRFELIDTGGIITNDDELIPTEILRQARVALESAAQIVFLIDGRTEITGADRELAAMLRRLGRPVTLAVNKIDTPKNAGLMHEFHALGFADAFPVSAEHRLGLDDLLEHITRDFPVADPDEAVVEAPYAIKVAIIGRPNVGKSTLLNVLVGSERSIVSPVAGTTRDAVDETIEHDGTRYTFVDTAGIRRKGKTTEMAEKLSVVMARRHIRMANVVLLIVDASEGVVGSDATIAGYAHEDGRAVIIVVNKWDLKGPKDKKEFTHKVRDQLKFLEYAPVVFVSAQQKRGTGPLFGLIRNVFDEASKRISTGELNRFMELVKFDRDVKVYYLTQASIRPPTFVVFTDNARNLHFSTERFIINQLRKRFGFQGTPIQLKPKRR
jgi:GTP-binding protein